MRRGLCRRLVFHADAAASELTRATAVLSDLARDTLVLGDRLYGTAAFFEALYGQRCWGLVRHNRELSLHKLQRLRKRRHADGMLEDWLVRRLRRLGPDPVVALQPVAPGRDPL